MTTGSTPSSPDFHGFWTAIDLTPESYDEMIDWLSEDRLIRDTSIYFFRQAALLFSYARADYQLCSAAFFHAVIGLERALRVRYGNPDEGISSLAFAVLFRRATEDGTLTDELFHRPKRLPYFMKKDLCHLPAEHALRLAALVPQWRNQHFHGNPVMAPELFYVALNLRELADALYVAPATRGKIRPPGDR